MKLNQKDTVAAGRLLGELKQSFTAKKSLRYQHVLADLEYQLAQSLQ
jgi:hypothetical protein